MYLKIWHYKGSKILKSSPIPAGMHQFLWNPGPFQWILVQFQWSPSESSRIEAFLQESVGHQKVLIWKTQWLVPGPTLHNRKDSLPMVDQCDPGANAEPFSFWIAFGCPGALCYSGDFHAWPLLEGTACLWNLSGSWLASYCEEKRCCVCWILGGHVWEMGGLLGSRNLPRQEWSVIGEFSAKNWKCDKI